MIIGGTISKPGIAVSEPEKLRLIEDFISQFLDGWYVPWYGPPVANLHFSLYSNGEFIGDFGVSEGFIIRTYGNFFG